MRLAWTYELPLLGTDAPKGGEAPLHWDGRHVWLPYREWAHPPEERAAQRPLREERFQVLRFSPDGRTSPPISFTAQRADIPSAWSFVELDHRLLLHVRGFHSLPSGERAASLPEVATGSGTAPTHFLQTGGLLIFADGRRRRLHAHDARTLEPRWRLDAGAPKPPSFALRTLGTPELRDGRVVWFAQGVLNYIEPSSGHIETRVSLRGLDVLYPPIPYGDDLLFPYCKASVGGVIRVSSSSHQVRWCYSLRGDVRPPRRGSMPIVDGTAILAVGDGSSLVGVDLESGTSRWRHRTQWLYTPPLVIDRSIVFGTAGHRDCHLRRHSAKSGETEWALPIEYGCAYFARHGTDELVVGDVAGVVRRVRLSDGCTLDEVRLQGPFLGPPLVASGRVFLLSWPHPPRRPELVCLVL